MGLYRPLVVTALLEGRELTEFHPTENMRLNLLASSNEDPRILYAVSDSTIQIYQFSTLTPSGPPTLVDRLVDPRRTNAELHSKTINVIKVGYLGTDEVLVAADEKGEVCVWFTMNLSRDPLLLSVTKSAWGIDIHASRRLIAISSNAYTATVFYCGTEARPSEQRTFRDTDETSQIQPTTEPESDLNIPSNFAASSSLSSSSMHGFPLGRLLQILQREEHDPQHDLDRDASRFESASQQILRGHKHNIPSVCFSPCGHFVATASIDQTCRTWRLSDGKQIQQRSLVPLWGWGVVFIPKDAWLTIQRSDYKMIPKSHLQPGKLPGQNVRDSPLWTATNPPRRFPIGRDQRMVRTRWFAGPLHGTSCDEADTEDELDENDDEADGQTQYSNIGQGISGHGHGGVNLRHSRRVGGEFYDDDDDRDAALFGMDDDDEGEGEDSGDEWEEYLSGSEESDLAEVEETEDVDASTESTTTSGTTSRASAIAIARILGIREPRTGSSHGTEFAVDTGDDGDDEQVGGMETEDGGGTTEDGRGSQSNSQLLRKPVSITETEVSEIGESSEYEQSSQRPDAALLSTSSNSHHALGQPPHPEQGQCPGGHGQATSTSTYPSESVQEQEQPEQLMTEQQLWNRDPKQFIHFSRTDQHLNAVTESPVHPSSDAPTRTPPTLAQHSSAPLPFPTELLAYATARNIYLLGPHYMPVKAPTLGRTNEGMGTNTTSGDTESDGMSEELTAPMSSGLPVHIVYGESGEDEEYDSEDVNGREAFRLAASILTEQIERHYGQEYDTDMEYDDMDYFMDETEAESEDDDQSQEGQYMDEENSDHHDGHEDDHEDDDDDDEDDDDDDDDDDMNLSIDSEGTSEGGLRRLNQIGGALRTFVFRGLDIAPLHYISVARAAVDRADGRRSRHLEHCDRLFVMRVIPELSVLITASQKGAVTVFRLLKVTDDSGPVEDGQEVHGHAHGSAPLGSQHGESGKSEKINHSFKKEVESSSMANPISGGSSSSRRLSDSRQDPGSQPSNLPGEYASSTKTGAAEITMKEGEHYVLFPEVYLPRHDLRPMPLLGVSAVAVQNYHRPEPCEGGAEGSTVSPIRASSFVLHLAYLDGQLFSYEIQLRGDKRDPVPAFNLFV